MDFFLSRDEAEETLGVILEDEPEWASILEVVPLELGDRGAELGEWAWVASAESGTAVVRGPLEPFQRSDELEQ